MQLMLVQEKFMCESRATLEVRSLDEMNQLLALSLDPVINARNCHLPTSGSTVQNSDMFRFLVLFLYGGLYVDADTLFLKDLAVFHGLSFGFKWGGEGNLGSGIDNLVVQGFNTAIMGLPKGSPIPGRIAQAAGCTPSGFYPSSVANNLGCSERDAECIGFAMMPSSLFDPIQATLGTEKWKDLKSYNGFFGGGDSFFDRPSPFADLANFFPGAFTYHWHNRWEMPVDPDSVYAQLVKLNSQCNPPTAGVISVTQPHGQVKPWFAALPITKDVASTEAVTVASTTHSGPRKIFVDLGGWKGDTLALYAQYLLERDDAAGGGFASKEAWVFEPDPRNIQVVLDKMEGDFSGDSMPRVGDELLTKVKPYTHLLQGAAWNKDKVLNFSSKSANRNDVTVSNEEEGFGIMGYDIGPWFLGTVKPTNDDFILFKIDIEGAEIETLESLNRTRALNYVDHLIVEWHDWIMPNVEKAKPLLVSMLRDEYGLVYKYATLDDKVQKSHQYGDRSTWPVDHCDSHYFRDGDTRADFL